MRRSFLLLLVVCATATAQVPNSTLPSPRLTSVFPCGGQAGKSFEVIVRGTDLDDATALRFSHKGLTAERIAPPEPPKGQPPRQPNLLMTAKFKVKLADDVPPGTHDVRVVSKFGVSNPRAFVVSTLPEVTEVEPNSDVPQAQKIEINSVVNGVIDNVTDVDYFKFEGKKGQRILAHCAASSIDSRMRAFVELYASDGRTRLGLNRNYSGNDALCDVTLPADGDYYLRVSEFAYTAGGPEYFYRLWLTDGPWLDAVFPPMIEPGQTALVYLIGRGLSGRDMERRRITAPTEYRGLDCNIILPQSAGIYDGFSVTPAGGNMRPAFFATATVILEDSGDNDTPEKAQVVSVPCEVAGCIYVKYDRDYYRFDAKRGEPVMIELFAERIGTTMDAVLSLRDANGRELVGEQQLDDDPEALHPTSFFNRTTDPPPFRFVPPSDGSYMVTVSARDSNANYGPRTIYRLRITPPKPDFRVLAMPRNRDFPSGITVTSGSDTGVDVFVQRLDGFNGPVELRINGLPAGVTAKPASIGTGQKWGLIILSGAADLKSTEADVTVNATATINGKKVERLARSGSITWPVVGAPGSPTIARLDRGLVIATRTAEKQPCRLTAKLEKATIRGTDGKERPATLPLEIKAGERINLPVGIEWLGDGTRPNVVNVAMEPTFGLGNQNPLGVNNGQQVVVPKDKNETTVIIEARPTAPPGYYTVLLRGDTRANMTTDATTKTKRDCVMLAFATPFPVTVVPTSLARVSAQPSQVKVGQTGTLTVRVERLFDFTDEFKVKITFPEKSGLSAKDAVIPANSSEVRVEVQAASDAKPGSVQNVAVQCVAMYDGKYKVMNETKTNININK